IASCANVAGVVMTMHSDLPWSQCLSLRPAAISTACAELISAMVLLLELVHETGAEAPITGLLEGDLDDLFLGLTTGAVRRPHGDLPQVLLVAAAGHVAFFVALAEVNAGLGPGHRVIGAGGEIERFVGNPLEGH